MVLSESLRNKIRIAIGDAGGPDGSEHGLNQLAALLIQDIECALEIEIAKGQDEIQLAWSTGQIVQALGLINHKLHKIMISQDALNASATRLETAAHTIINLLPGNSVPSTPDTVVAAFQGRVDGASAALEAAATTGSTGTTPPATPPATPAK